MRAIPAALLLMLALSAVSGLAAEATSPSAATERIRKLIAELGAEEFYERERAQLELKAIGLDAFDLLAEAADDVDIEIAQRAQFLMRDLPIDWFAPGDAPEVKVLLTDFEMQVEAKQIEILDRLVALPEEKGLRTLARIARFDLSNVRSKLAATKLIHQTAPPAERAAQVALRIRELCGASSRPAVAWLKRYASELENKADGPAWDEFAIREAEILQHSSGDSRPEIIAGLWRRQFNVLIAAGDKEKAREALLHIVKTESGDPERLMKLIDWLVEHQAWQGIDEVSRRFSNRIEGDAELLYSLARARTMQGDKSQASKHAQQALKLNPSSQDHHLGMAVLLMERGLVDWSEAEFRLTISLGNPNSPRTLAARKYLGEMLHDHARDLAAAEALEPAIPIVAELATKGFSPNSDDDSDFSYEVRAHFFRACHYSGTGDFDKEIYHLRKAFEKRQSDIDILIALYRAPKIDPELMQIVKKSIRAETENMQREARSGSDTGLAQILNNYAWLIANTEGDFREALQASKRSVAAYPDNAGFLDTLARCYYAAGDLENAVKQQTEAVRLDRTNSGQIRRQLAFFQEAIAKAK